MAYSSVRVQFEIGHEASVRTKKTPEGFTHDWEVFVRGADNTDIQCFVDKVVFHLHETFQKPRRVIKEPPYVVKESGYAGFVLPIDVYLKNKEEPKKISFQYDLQLQNSGPPISRVLREPRVFQNPSEDFRRKLIRGGGVGVDTPSDTQADDSKSASVGGLVKKVTESPIKKYKPGSSPNNTFSELFGTPIRRVAPEVKKVADVVKKVPEVETSKDKKKSSKHSPHKDEKDIPKERDKYSDKDRIKEKEKTKDKQQKRPPSPVVIKPKEEHRKQHEEKDKKKENDHDEKKKRKEEKDKKDKFKDIKETEKQSDKDFKKEKKDSKEEFNIKKINSSKPDIKVSSDKLNNESEKDKERPEKEKHKHRHKKKEKEKNRDKEKHRKDKDKSEKDYKEKDKDRDKLNKKKHEEVKQKDEKKRKSRSPSPVPEKPKKGPLNALLDELGSSDSASALSDDEEDSIPSFKSLPKTTAKNVPDIKSQPVVNPTYKSTNLSSSNEIKEPEKKSEETPSKNKKDKSPGKKNKKSDKDLEKKKPKDEYRNRSSSEREKEEEDLERIRREREKIEVAEREQAIKERELALKEREQAMKEAEKALKNSKKDKESIRKRKRDKSIEPPSKTKKESGSENSITASQSIGAVESSDASDEIRKADKFTKEYVAQLRDLQHRIMTIEDNAELQKVVQVIAETGQYEITKKTFDFDLCALDCDTVKRLQEFFTT